MSSNLDKLKAMPIGGNAHADSELFALAHVILMDGSESTDNKIEALRKIDEAMGLDSEPEITGFDVDEYVSSFEVEEEN